jgi:hypothetical protein
MLQWTSAPSRKPLTGSLTTSFLTAQYQILNKKTEIKDRQCAEVNRQKIEGESPLSGKAQQAFCAMQAIESVLRSRRPGACIDVFCTKLGRPYRRSIAF